MKIDLDIVREQARRELEKDAHRQAVEQEKERLRERANRGFWQRLIDKLPFTIQRKKA